MASTRAFPTVDAKRELNPSMNKDFQVDPISSDIATTKVKEPNPSMNEDFQIDPVSLDIETTKGKEMNPGMNTDLQVDPISSNIATTQEIKEQLEAKKLEEQENKEALQSFKRALTVSGIIVAVAGAIFAITKKLREK